MSSTAHIEQLYNTENAAKYSEMMTDAELSKDLYATELPALLERAAQRSPQAQRLRIVDAGCGSGDCLKVLMRAARRHRRRLTARGDALCHVSLVGVDLSRAMLELADAKLSAAHAEDAGDAGAVDFELKQGLLDALPAKDATAHALLSYFVLHHLFLDDVASAVAEFKRVLVPRGGELLLAFWHGSGRIEYPAGDDTVAYLHTHEQLAKALQHAGFSVDSHKVQRDDAMEMDFCVMRASL